MKISRLSWAPLVALAAVACSTEVASESPADAPAGTVTASEKAQIIEQFAERVHARWDLTIRQSDYDVVTTRRGPLIMDREAMAARRETEGDSEEPTVVTSQVTIPSTERMKQEIADGRTTFQEGVQWREPKCMARLGDKDGEGWMDICYQQGYMDYAAKTRDNWAWRWYGSCAPVEGGPDHMEMDECYIRLWQNENVDPRIVWNAWDPQATVNLPDCGDVSMSVTAGPVSAGQSIHTCEKLVPKKGVKAGDMQATWIGDAYWAEDVRGVGFMVSIGIPFGEPEAKMTYYYQWGYKYSMCNLPPSAFDQCDVF